MTPLLEQRHGITRLVQDLLVFGQFIFAVLCFLVQQLWLWMVAKKGERDKSGLRCRSFVHKQESQLVSGTAQGMLFSLSLFLFKFSF